MYKGSHPNVIFHSGLLTIYESHDLIESFDVKIMPMKPIISIVYKTNCEIHFQVNCKCLGFYAELEHITKHNAYLIVERLEAPR